jgi:hypothetical protein
MKSHGWGRAFLSHAQTLAAGLPRTREIAGKIGDEVETVIRFYVHPTLPPGEKPANLTR